MTINAIFSDETQHDRHHIFIEDPKRVTKETIKVSWRHGFPVV